MRAQLVRLQAAFPEFSFTIGPGWRGLTFEAWRDTGGAGLYAVITGMSLSCGASLRRARADQGR